MLTIYTNRFLKPWEGANRVLGTLVFIRPKHRNDPAIHAHELAHCKQFKARWLTHGYLYRFNREYRLKAEAEAYHASWKNGCDLDEAARSLATYYDLAITEAQARETIMQAESV